MGIYQDTTNLGDALRPVYNEYIKDVKEIYKPSIEMFAKGKAPIVDSGYGTGWRYTIALGGNRGGIAAMTESQTLPAAYRQKHDQYTIPIKIMAGRIKLTILSQLASQKKGGFNADALTIETEGIIQDMMDIMNIDVWGSGQGDIGKVKTGVTGTVIELDDPYGIRNIREEDLIDVCTLLSGSSGADEVDNVLVTSVDESNVTMTLASSQTVTAGSYVVRAGAQDATFPTGGRHIMGINGIVDDGSVVATYNNIARSGVRKVQGHVMTASSDREISQLLMQDAFHKAQRSMGKKVTPDDYKFCTSEGIHDSYLELLLPARIFQTSTFSGGYKGTLDYNGIEIQAEYTHPKNQMELLNTKEIQFYELDSLGFIDGYTDDVLTLVPDKLEKHGILTWFSNLASTKPRANVKIEKIAE